MHAYESFPPPENDVARLYIVSRGKCEDVIYGILILTLAFTISFISVISMITIISLFSVYFKFISSNILII